MPKKWRRTCELSASFLYGFSASSAAARAAVSAMSNSRTRSMSARRLIRRRATCKSSKQPGLSRRRPWYRRLSYFLSRPVDVHDATWHFTIMIFALVAASATAALTLGLLAVFALLLLRLRVSLGLRGGGTRTVAFLHPFCNDGGGGERVLWVAIRDLLRESSGGTSSPWRVVVYTGDAASDDEIRAHAASRFGVHVPADIEFVRLKLRGWIEPKRYPVATLIGQALGSLVLAAEAVARCPPHTLVDTTGLHFCLPLLRLFGVPKLACYVHYPIISSDMIGAVQQRKAAHNNARVFARSAAGAQLKLAYYRLLVWVYAKAGRVSHATMANGSWTAGHIRALWAVAPALVFPPCDTAALQALPMEPPGGPAHSRAARRLVLSVAQFRPEKDHAKQIRSFATVLRTWQARAVRLQAHGH